MKGKHQYPEHGTDKIDRGKLRGTTDTDYFYFLCPKCCQILQVELLETYASEDGKTQGKHGWRGGRIENVLNRGESHAHSKEIQ